MSIDRQAYQRLASIGRCAELDFVAGRIGIESDSDPLTRHSSTKSPEIVADIARLNKLGVPIGRSIELSGCDGCGPEINRLLQSYRRRLIALNAAAMATTKEAASALTEAGIAFVVFKGPVQQKLLHGDYFFKPSGDVDILVATSRFEAARQALAGIGYTVSRKSNSRWWSRFLGEQHLETQSRRSATIDLHHRLQQPGSASPRQTRRFIERRIWLDCAGTQIPFLNRHDILLLACMSAAKGFYNRQAWTDHVLDINAVLSQLTESECGTLLHDAREQGLAATLAYGLRLSAAFGDLPETLGSAAQGFLPEIDDRTLVDIMMAPWLKTIKWPSRRRFLWELCDRRPGRFLTEAGWATAAELARRAHGQKLSTKSRSQRRSSPWPTRQLPS